MSVPDYQAFMRPMLECLAKGPASVRDFLPAVVAALDLDEEAAGQRLPSGKKTLVADRAHWARSYLGKAGLTRSVKRGVHEITPLGLKLLAEMQGPIDNETLAAISTEFTDWKLGLSSATGKSDSAEPKSASPREILETTHRDLLDGIRSDLLDNLRAMDPIAFEGLVLRLLNAMGYGAGAHGSSLTTKASGDGGIDGVIFEDALGLDGVYIQAKRYAETTVGRPAVQAFAGSLLGATASKGVFVTTSTFSKDARQFVENLQQRIVLIDGETLADLMIRHGVGVRQVARFAVYAIDENLFAEE